MDGIIQREGSVEKGGANGGSRRLCVVLNMFEMGMRKKVS